MKRQRCAVAQLVGAASLIFMGVAGCASDSSSVAETNDSTEMIYVLAESGPWASEFERVYQEATNDFVRRIVADGELTLPEMREAAVRTMECFESVDAIFRIVEIGYGAFSVTFDVPDGMTVEEALNVFTTEESVACEAEYFNELWGLWNLIRANPDAVDLDVLTAECLIRHGLADSGLTGRKFREAASVCDFEFVDDPENPMTVEERRILWEEHLEATRDCRPQLPGGVYLDEGQAWDCQMDPSS